jgi:hypothetical protein
MKLIDPSHHFYRPLLVRVAIVAVCLGWAIVEATAGEPIWGIAVGAVGVYAAWMLLLNYTPPAESAAVQPRREEPDGSDD